MSSKGRQRQGKWYFKNEIEVMESLGLTPTPGSGSGWIHKEDGENDYILCQLKSTDKQSYRIQKLDIEKLEYNATVSNKIPLFLIQFLKDNSMYALVNLEDIPYINEYINIGKIENIPEAPLNASEIGTKKPKIKKIKSSKAARELFYQEKQKEWENRRKR